MVNLQKGFEQSCAEISDPMSTIIGPPIHYICQVKGNAESDRYLFVLRMSLTTKSVRVSRLALAPDTCTNRV